jgi:hypothetical protein
MGITLNQDDLEDLVLLFEVKERFNKLRQRPEINYNLALKNILPVLTKN